MLNLAQNNLILLGLAILVGMAAGRWMFARRRPAPDKKPEDSPQS